MNLYKIWQTVNGDWNVFDSAIVAALSEEDARKTHPSNIPGNWEKNKKMLRCWCSPNKVQVELIGIAVPGTKAGVILSSFTWSVYG